MSVLSSSVRAACGRIARVWATLAYGGVLLCVDTTLLALGPDWQDKVIRHASTNLHNLSQGHLGTLLASAFVVDASPVAVWLPGFLCLLGVAELTWGSGRLLVAMVVGHLGATLVVAGVLVAGVRGGWLSGDVTTAIDVGMSYAAAAVLGALTPAVARRWRPAWFLGWLAAGAGAVLAVADFTDVGHLVALTLGTAVAMRFGAPAGWTPARLTLLGVGAAFGLLVIAGTAAEMAVAVPSGVAAAAVGLLVGSRTSRSARAARVARVTADP
jgi:hypothetical protein